MASFNCGKCDACLEVDMKGYSPFQRIAHGLECHEKKRPQHLMPDVPPSKLEKLEALIKDPDRLKQNPKKKKRREEEVKEVAVLALCEKCDACEDICPCTRA